MCRNIRPLHNFEPPTTHDEVHEAALQYVRKVSGMQKPSQANQAAFERAGLYTFLELAHDVGELDEVPELRFVAPAGATV